MSQLREGMPQYIVALAAMAQLVGLALLIHEAYKYQTERVMGHDTGSDLMMKPTYAIQDLINDCGSGSGVSLSRDAETDARVQFGLTTKQAVRDFIANDGLESPQFVNTELWRNNPNKAYKIMVDAYRFASGEKRGYIAFIRPCPIKPGCWHIKSFHLEDDPAHGFHPFENLPEILALPAPKETEPKPPKAEGEK